VWWIIILIVLILVIVAIGYYVETTNIPKEASPESAALETQGTSDELADIQADLDATDLESLDTELSDIDAELEAAGL